MKPTMTPARLAKALKKVPAKRFAIMDLAPQLVDAKGHVDVARAIDRQADLNLAIIEVQSYIKASRAARESLEGIGGRKLAVDDWLEDEDVDVAEDET